MSTIFSAPVPQVTERPSRKPTFLLLLRHQTASLVATLVDFGTMVAVVEAFHVSAAIATFIGASLGAITNFTVSRVWAFRTRHLPLMGQAVRYAMVSFGSVMINSLGEWLVNGRMHVEYIVARLLVSVAVSLLWNFPMHRGFVFRDRSSTLT